MMRFLYLILALFLSACSNADAWMPITMMGGNGTVGCIENCATMAELTCQGFNTTVGGACDPCTEDNEESWNPTDGAGSHDFDHTPALLGAESLRLVSASSSTTYVSHDFSSASSHMYGHLLFYVSALPGSGTSTFYRVYNSGYTAMMDLRVTATTGVINLKCGTTIVTTTNGLSAMTLYHIFTEYENVDGVNDYCSVGFSEDGSTPTGNYFIDTSNGDMGSDAYGIRLIVTQNLTYDFDQVYFSETPFECIPTE